MKKFFWGLFFLLLTLIPSHSLFHAGAPYTHDGENHLARLANYYIAFKEGQWPPRFAPNLLNHYGYPVFNYNYPLANLISLPFSVLDFSYVFTYKLIIFAFVYAGLWGAYCFLSQHKFGTGAKIFALTTFALTPYLLVNINIRGNIGEVMAFALLPWLFYASEKLKEQSNKIIDRPFLLLVLVLILFFLSHNIAALFGSSLLIFYAAFAYGKNWRVWKKFILAFFWAFVACLWFWLPALAEKHLVTLDQVELNQQFAQHFLSLQQLLDLTISFGFSRPGSIDDMSFGLGLLQLVLLLFLLIYLLLAGKKTPPRPLLFGLIILLLLFGQLAISEPLYRLFPPASFIQFPWRLALFLAVPLLYVAAFLWQQLKPAFRYLLLLLLLFQLGQFYRFQPIDYGYKQDADYEFFTDTTTTAKENMPRTFKYDGFADWQPTAQITQGEGEMEVEFWRGSKRQYRLDLLSDSLIIEPTAYFPGWQTKVKKLDETAAKWQTVDYVDDEVIQGRVAYELSAGQYLVNSRFYQLSWSRRLGNTLSVGALLLLALASFRVWWPRKRLQVKQ